MSEQLITLISKHINGKAIEVKLPKLRTFFKQVETNNKLCSLSVESIPVNFLNVEDMQYAADYHIRYYDPKYPNNKKEIEQYIEHFKNLYESSFNDYCIDAKIYIADKIDWEEGEYGDAGSCYWGSNALAKDNILAHGGFAVKIHDAKNRKMGRCWGVVENNSIILWNAYFREGSIGLVDIAFALGKALNIKYGKNIRLVNNGSGGGQVYINLQKGIALTNEEDLYNKKREYDLNWKELVRPECSACGYYIPVGDEVTTTEDGYIYCENCAAKYVVVCSGTKQLVSKNNCYKVSNLYYQEGYFVGHFNRCLFSEELLPVNELIKVENGVYVSKKLKSKLVKNGRKYYLTGENKGPYNPNSYANSLVLKSAAEILSQYRHTEHNGNMSLSWRKQRNVIVELL